MNLNAWIKRTFNLPTIEEILDKPLNFNLDNHKVIDGVQPPHMYYETINKRGTKSKKIKVKVVK